MKDLNDDALKAIIARRDRRFDGRLYFGVKTTRIYCRPVCPAKAKPENILIFRSPSEAENHGYRPCLRCHPDVAPGSRLLDGTMKTVSRALRIIHDSADENLNVESLACTLGVTDRHLRRLFDEHLGASPIEIMITQRLHFAKQTLQETALPVAEVAFASGFRSLRRFNEAFKSRYHSTPTEFRRRRGVASDDRVSLKIPIRLPYDWDTLLTFLKRHETYGIELIGGDTYRRFIPQGNTFGSVVIAHRPKQDYLSAQFIDVPLTEIRFVLARIKTLFDTDHNPANMPVTKPLEPRGIRVPASFDPFETAVSIILSQLVSTTNAKALLRRLVEQFGQKIGEFSGQPVFAFPSPAVLATAKVEKVGMTQTRAAAIRELAKAVLAGAINFKAPMDFAVAERKHLGIKGIGPWTAAMVSMRCLGNPDAFPELDLIVRRALASNLVNPSQWATSRAYLTHCLWRDYGQTLTKTKGATP